VETIGLICIGLSGEKRLVQNETTIFSKAPTSSSSMTCPAAKDSTTISAIYVNNYLSIYLFYLYFDYLSFYVYGKKQCNKFNSFYTNFGMKTEDCLRLHVYC